MPTLKNPKHEAYAQGVFKGLAACEAYEKAGYKPSRPAASRLSTNVNIVARIAELQGRAAEKAVVTEEMILRELAKIGFSDIRNVVEWGDGIAITNPETNEVTIANGVCLVSSSDIDDDAAGAIAEVSQTKEGLKIKMYDKKGALVEMGKHLGMFKDDKGKTGDIHLHFDGLLKGVL